MGTRERMMIRATRASRMIVVVALAAAGACASGSRPAAEKQPRLTVTDSVTHLEALAREPMVVQHPSGALFLTGYSGSSDPRAVPQLWRSEDGGVSWSQVDVGTAEEGAAGNSDVDLAIGPGGTLYFVVMGFDQAEGVGRHITVGVSDDLGASWGWTFLSRERFADRPWVEVAPDGIAHVIWNDGSGVMHAMSADAGRSWTEGDRVHPLGGSSHLAVGPAGEIAIRITPASASGHRLDPEADFIAVSGDAGRTWTKHPPPAAQTWSDARPDDELAYSPDLDSLMRWVEPVAWDLAGNLYHLWSEGRDLWLGRSVDGGATWERWRIASDRERVMFPYLVARGEGELAATWYSGVGDRLRGNLVSIRFEGADAPSIVARAAPIMVNAWSRSGDRRDTGGEYLPVTFLQDGALGVVTPVQDPGDGIPALGFTWWRFERQ